jgi:hypothetical protein
VRWLSRKAAFCLGTNVFTMVGEAEATVTAQLFRGHGTPTLLYMVFV